MSGDKQGKNTTFDGKNGIGCFVQFLWVYTNRPCAPFCSAAGVQPKDRPNSRRGWFRNRPCWKFCKKVLTCKKFSGIIHWYMWPRILRSIFVCFAAAASRLLSIILQQEVLPQCCVPINPESVTEPKFMVSDRECLPPMAVRCLPAVAPRAVRPCPPKAARYLEMCNDAGESRFLWGEWMLFCSPHQFKTPF